MNVIIADDSAFIRDILRETVLSLLPDAHITEAEDGEQVLQLCAENLPDFALLDLVMPGKTGLDVIEEIGGKVPIVVVTATDQTQLIEQAKKHGVQHFVFKPFEEEQVVQAIQQCLSQS